MEIKFLGASSLDNIAFAKEERDGTNMLLIDFAESIGKKFSETNVLEGVKRVIAFGTHIHTDHINGVKQVEQHCEQRNIKLKFLLPSITRQFGQMCAAIVALGLNKVDVISPSEAAHLLNLREIEFKAMRHNSINVDNLLGFEKVDTTALVMTTKMSGVRNKIVYAVDNDDVDFVRGTLCDMAMHQLFLDTTLIGRGWGMHFTLEKLEKVARDLRLGDKMKKRIVGMHFYRDDVADAVKKAGYSVATDRLYSISR